MEEYRIPELTLEQITDLCERAELTARKYILSKIPTTRITILDVTVYTEETKPLTVNVDVSVVLSPLMKDFNVDELTKEATKRAFSQIERNLRELKCKSKKL